MEDGPGGGGRRGGHAGGGPDSDSSRPSMKPKVVRPPSLSGFNFTPGLSSHTNGTPAADRTTLCRVHSRDADDDDDDDDDGLDGDEK